MNRFHFVGAARVASLGACIAMLGCGAAGEGSSGAGKETDTAPSIETSSSAAQSNLSDSELQTLADNYLNLRVDKAGIAKIQGQIRALSPAQAHKLGQFVLAMGHPEEKARALSEAALDYAESKGISFLDIKKDDGRVIKAQFLGVPLESVPLDGDTEETTKLPSAPSGVGVAQEAQCGLLEAACGWTSAWNSWVGRTICTSGCTVGSGWDRAGNAPCEAIACDYRMWFPRASGSWLDGATPAADCILSYYGALNKYSTGGYTYVGYGIGGPAYCLFYPTNPAAYYVLK